MSCHIKVLPKIMYIRKDKWKESFTDFKKTAIFGGIKLIERVQFINRIGLFSIYGGSAALGTGLPTISGFYRTGRRFIDGKTAQNKIHPDALFGIPDRFYTLPNQKGFSNPKPARANRNPSPILSPAGRGGEKRNFPNLFKNKNQKREKLSHTKINDPAKRSLSPGLFPAGKGGLKYGALTRYLKIKVKGERGFRPRKAKAHYASSFFAPVNQLPRCPFLLSFFVMMKKVFLVKFDLKLEGRNTIKRSTAIKTFALENQESPLSVKPFRTRKTNAPLPVSFKFTCVGKRIAWQV